MMRASSKRRHKRGRCLKHYDVRSWHIVRRIRRRRQTRFNGMFLEYYSEFDKRQGICHVVGPEQGFTLPGTVI